MERLRPWPATPANQENPNHLPGDPIGHQHFARQFVPLAVPENQDPHLVLDSGNMQVAVKCLCCCRPRRIGWRSCGSMVAVSSSARDQLLLPFHLAVELPLAQVGPWSPETALLTVNMVDNLGVGEEAVEGKVAGNSPLGDPIYPSAAELRVVDELLGGGFALLALAEPAKF